MSGGRTRPSAQLTAYSGPYSRRMLEDARQELINIIDSKDTVLWHKIRKKTGIFSNGERDNRLLGWGPASCLFSHADLKDSVELEPKIVNSNNNDNATLIPSTSQQAKTELNEVNPKTHVHTSQNRTSFNSVPHNTDSNDQSPDVILLQNDLALESSARRESTLSSANQNYSEVIVLDNYSPQHSVQSVSSVDSAPHSSGVILVDSDPHEVVLVENDPSDYVVQVPLNTGTRFNLADIGESADFFPLSNGLAGNALVAIPNQLGKKKHMLWGSGACTGAKSGPDFEKNEAEKSNLNKNCDTKTQVDDEHANLDEKEFENEKSDSSVLKTESIGWEKNKCVSSPVPISDEPRAVFQCDFCETVTDTGSQMEQHLKDRQHYSASTYYANHDKSPVRLKERLVQIYKPGLNKHFLVVCPGKQPSCKKVFSTTHECSLHYSIEHTQGQSSSPIYALVPIVQETFVTIKRNKECSVCKQTFNSWIKLSSHLKKAKHLPFRKIKGLRWYFYCCMCQQFFSNFVKLFKGNAHDCILKIEKNLRVKIFFGARMEIRSFANRDLPAAPGTKRTLSEISVRSGKKVRLETTTKDAAVVDNNNSDMDRQTSDESKSGCYNPFLQTCERKTDPSKLNLKVYKCDYCDAVYEDYLQMRGHLFTEKHRSASMVVLNLARKPVYVEMPIAINILESKFNVMAVCPASKCRQAFEDIYTCAEHYSFVHDQAADPVYGVATVQSCEFLTFQLEQDEKFWIPAAACGDSCYKSYLCFCQATFCTRASLISHVNTRHRKKKQTSMSVRVVTVRKDCAKHTLLPFPKNKAGERRCIARQIQSLKNLKKSVIKSKKHNDWKKPVTISKKHINRKIQQLRKLQGNDIGISDS